MNTGYSLENIQDDVKQMMNNLRNYTLDSSDPSPCPTPLYHIKERRESMEVHPKKRERGREGSHHPLSFGTDYENVKWNLQDCYRPRATSPGLIGKRMT